MTSESEPEKTAAAVAAGCLTGVGAMAGVPTFAEAEDFMETAT